MENNFGLINTIFLQNAEQLLKTKSGKQLVKEYVNKIKGSKELTKQNSLYEYIENQVDSENIKEYVTEAINYLSDLDKKKLKLENKELSDLLGKHNLKLIESDVKTNELHSNIDDLIFVGNSIKSINEKVDKINYVVEHIKSKKANVIVENKQNFKITEDVIGYMLSKFNEKYKEQLSPEDVKLFESLTSGNEKEQAELFEQYNGDCLKLTNDTLTEDIDSTTREKLINVKEALLEEKYNKETFVEDILKMIDLKNTLED
jgi:hypothetical protein